MSNYGYGNWSQTRVCARVLLVNCNWNGLCPMNPHRRLMYFYITVICKYQGPRGLHVHVYNIMWNIYHSTPYATPLKSHRLAIYLDKILFRLQPVCDISYNLLFNWTPKVPHKDGVLIDKIIQNNCFMAYIKVNDNGLPWETTHRNPLHSVPQCKLAPRLINNMSVYDLYFTDHACMTVLYG